VNCHIVTLSPVTCAANVSQFCDGFFLSCEIGFWFLFVSIAHICHANSFCLSVRPSVTRVLAVKTAEHIIKILSRSDRPIILVFHHQGLLTCCVNLMPSPPMGAPNTRGGSDFWPMCGYISETVIDRGIVTMEDEYKVVCAVSNSATFDDLEWPWTPVLTSQYTLRRISRKWCIRSTPCLVLG